MNAIQQMFEQEGHRLKAAMEKLNELCNFGGQLLPSFAPKNYTNDVWCDLSNEDGRAELRRRLDDLEGCLPAFAIAIQKRLREKL